MVLLAKYLLMVVIVIVLTSYTLFTELLNTLYKSGVYPDQWSTGIISPIFEKGNPEDTNNYRGISLTNIVAKI